MEKNPLEDFNKLLDADYMASEEFQFSINPGATIEKIYIDGKEYDDIVITDAKEDLFTGQPQLYYLTFTEDISNKVLLEKKNILSFLDSKVLTFSSKEAQDNYLQNVVNSIDYLVQQTGDLSHLNKHKNAIDIIKYLNIEIANKYQLQINPSNKSKKQNMKTTRKIQWLANTNVLTTLFYDLLNGVKADGIQPLIKATPKDIERMIVENFIDQDGNEFQMKSTIQDYLKPSKQNSKRAKGEIYIKVGKI